MGLALKKLAIDGVNIDTGFDAVGRDAVRQRRCVGKAEAPSVCRYSNVQSVHCLAPRREAQKPGQCPDELARRRRLTVEQYLAGIAGIGRMMVNAQIDFAAIHITRSEKQVLRRDVDGHDKVRFKALGGGQSIEQRGQPGRGVLVMM